jgi:hypothetical protein
MSHISFVVFFTLIHLLSSSIANVNYNNEDDVIEFIPEHSNEWAVRIDEGDDIAELVATELGLKNKRKVCR